MASSSKANKELDFITKVVKRLQLAVDTDKENRDAQADLVSHLQPASHPSPQVILESLSSARKSPWTPSQVTLVSYPQPYGTRESS
jgi:hypothetical protein